MRITTRMAHSRAAVEVQESGKEVTCTGRPSVPSDWVLLPGNARRRYVEASQLRKSCVMRLNSLHLIGWLVRKVWLRKESWLVELATTM